MGTETETDPRRTTAVRSAARRVRVAAVACGLAAVSIAGCGGDPPPQIAKVTGTVTLDGEPVDGVSVTFLPVRAEGARPLAAASGVTGADGTYSLVYRGKDFAPEGAAVGTHVVTVTDAKSENSRDEAEPLPYRLPLSHAVAGTSPLKAVVTEEPTQVIDLKIDSE